MAGEGEVAPGFELPGVRDGEIAQVALDEYLGQEVVILAFYPGDFNPACDGTTSGLDDLDLFTMQKDVEVLAISGDSVFSHRAFADEYNLDVPLLADVDNEVAAAYDVEAESDRYKTRRAVFVIDHNGDIEYRWVADDIGEMPDSDEIHHVIENVGDDETAQSRYRVGHAHYIEGRRAFTSAMKAFEDREWMLASQDFTQASEEFDEAKEEFNSAVRFGSAAQEVRYYERAEQKAETLWRAAQWLSESAGAFASGQGLRGEELKSDAEAPLETAREIHEPVEPEGFPPDSDPAGDDAVLSTEREERMEIELEETPGDEHAAEGTTESIAEPDDEEMEDAATAEAETATEEDEGEKEDDIDDAELEAITAELEEQNEAVKEESDDSVTDDEQSEPTDDGAEDEQDEDIELDLTDPNDDEEDEDDEDDETTLSEDMESSGDHGVPDSL